MKFQSFAFTLLLAPLSVLANPMPDTGDTLWNCGRVGDTSSLGTPLKKRQFDYSIEYGEDAESQNPLFATAEEWDDSITCMGRESPINWVWLHNECRCMFYDDKECKNTHETPMGQGDHGRKYSFKGAQSYKCAWGYA